MTEEVTQPENTPEPELNDIEKTAMEHGWRPKEDFESDEKNQGKKWRSAEDFMERKSFFDRIESQSHEIKTLKKGLKSFAEHYTNVEKAAFQRAYNELKAQRREALEDGETLKAEDIKEQMDDLKDKIESVKPPVEVDDTPVEAPEFIEWKSRNSWYKQTNKDEISKFADTLGLTLHQEGKSPSEVLREVEKRVRKAYPERFRNPNRDNAPEVVEPGNKRTETKSGFRLSDEERKIMNNMVRTGIMTEDQYIADLKKMKGL